MHLPYESLEARNENVHAVIKLLSAIGAVFSIIYAVNCGFFFKGHFITAFKDFSIVVDIKEGVEFVWTYSMGLCLTPDFVS